MATRPEVQCRTSGDGPGTASEFVLMTTHSTKAILITLLDGDNIVEVDSTALGISAGLSVSKEDMTPQVR